MNYEVIFEETKMQLGLAKEMKANGTIDEKTYGDIISALFNDLSKVKMAELKKED